MHSLTRSAIEGQWLLYITCVLYPQCGVFKRSSLVSSQGQLTHFSQGCDYCKSYYYSPHLHCELMPLTFMRSIFAELRMTIYASFVTHVL